MTWVSYAQNYEDVVLVRVLADVAQGRYIDVGAHDPRVDSVTCVFYERGWRGINIEPVQHWHQRLLAARPEDLNLRLAAGDHAGMLRLYEVVGTGLSTVRADLAARHRASGLPVREWDVAVQTLDAICAGAGPGEVHFLKIDAEGAEPEVLRGFSFLLLRPWVVLVEATEPNSRVPACAAWEPALLGHDYDLAYEDGINRFYLAREHADLAGRFGPPTVLDDFVRREQVDIAAMLESRLGETDALARGRAEAIAIMDAHIRRVESALSSASVEVDRLHGLVSVRDRHVAELDAGLSAGRAALATVEATAANLHSRLADAESRMLAQGAELSSAAALAQRQELEGATRQLALTRLSMLVPDLEAELRGATSVQATTAAEVRRQDGLIAMLQADQSRILGSRSWRVTAPLRALRLSLADAVETGARLARSLARNRVMRGAVALVLRPAPGIAARLKLRLYGIPPTAFQAAPTLALTEDAERILRLAPVVPAPARARD